MIVSIIRSPIEHLSATRSHGDRASAFGAVSTGPAHAQNAPPGSAASKSGVLEEVVITGTRRIDRSVTDSASPVDIISGSDINAQPTANMLDSVRNIVPSFFVGTKHHFGRLDVRACAVAARPAVRPGAGHAQRQAIQSIGPGSGLQRRRHGPVVRVPRVGHLVDSVDRDQETRSAARRRHGAVRVGCDRRRAELRIAGRRRLRSVARYGQYQKDSDGESQQIAMNFGMEFGESGFANLSAEYNDDGQTSRGVTRPTAVAFARGESGPREHFAALPAASADLGQLTDATATSSC